MTHKRQRLTTAKWAMACCLLSLSSYTTYAQTFDNVQQWQPLIFEGSNTVTTDPLGAVIDAYVDSQAPDICARIATAWTGAMQNVAAATIDARGFQLQSTLSCQQSPFPNNAKGRLLLGNQTILTSVPWIIPSGVEVVGIGTGGASSSVGTTLKARSNFGSTNHALLELGIPGSSQSDAKVRNLAVDCNGVAQCQIGILNIAANDNARVENVIINNAPVVGLLVIVTDINPDGQNSGAYRDISVQYALPTCCNSPGTSPCNIRAAVARAPSASTNGIVVECLLGTCNSVVQFDSITASAFNAAGAQYGFYVNGVPVVLTNGHFENYTANEIKIGDGVRATTNVKIENVSVSTANSGVLIEQTSSNILLIGISGPVSNPNYVILISNYPDPLKPTSITAPFLGFYALGSGTNWTDCAGGACPALVSSSWNFKWRAPAGYIP